jgi:hypothetical protein
MRRNVLDPQADDVTSSELAVDSRCRRAPAIFGKNHDIGVVKLQRVGNSGQPGSAALPDVPSE